MRISDWSSDVCSSDLTKRFEQVHTLLAGDAAAWLDMDAHHGQGEFVLIVHEADDSQADDDTDMSVLPLLDALLESVSVRDAARIAAKVSGQPRDTLYALARSEEHTSELQSLMRISYAVFCLKKKITK